MERVDLQPPTDAAARRADAYASAPLLNCLLREVAQPVPDTGERAVYRLPGTGRLLRVRPGRRPAGPEVRTDGEWHRVTHAELVKLVAEELRGHTGLPNDDLPAEMLDSRDTVAALLVARARTIAPDDPYLRSEQSLITGHPHHPAPKARGGGPVAAWLPYAPEAHARFPLVLLGVREDQVAEEGDTAALDALGTAPPGYRLLPAHPWQLDLLARELAPAFADRRLIRLGTTDSVVWPTAAVRTVYEPARDLFLKFSLDVRITNDIRRLWRHDLEKLGRTDTAARHAFAAMDPPAAWLSDRGTAPPPSPSRNSPSWSATACAATSCPAPRPCSRPGSLRASTGTRWPPRPIRTPGGRRICARSSRPRSPRSTRTGSCWRRTCRTPWSPSTPPASPCRRCSGTPRAPSC